MSQINNGSLNQLNYDEQKQLYNIAYLQADADTKAFLDNYMNSYKNELQMLDLPRLSAKQRLARIYQAGREIAVNGISSFLLPQLAAEPSRERFFAGGYSYDDNINEANRWLYGFMSNARGAQQNTLATTQLSPELQERTRYMHSWKGNLSPNAFLSTDTVKDRILLLAKNMREGIGTTLQHFNNGDLVWGAEKSDIQKYNNAYILLGDLIQKVQSGQYDGKEANAISLLRDIAINTDAGDEISLLEDYLSGRLTLQTEQQAALALANEPEGKQYLRTQGYKLDIAPESLKMKLSAINYFKKNGHHIVQDPAGNYQIVNSSYSGFVLNLGFLNDDWLTAGLQNSSFGYGLFTDLNGKLWFGNVNDVLSNPNHDFYSIVSGYVGNENTGRRKLRSDLYAIYDGVDRNFTYSDNKLIQAMLHTVDTDGSPLLSGQFADVSKLFDSGKSVIAVNKDGTPFNEFGDQFGNLSFNDNTYFYFLGDNGKVLRVSWKSMKGTLLANPLAKFKNLGHYNTRGFNSSSPQIQIESFATNDTTDITLDRNASGISGWSEFWSPLTGRTTYSPLGHFDAWSPDISKNPLAWAEDALRILAKKENDRTDAEDGFIENFTSESNIIAFIDQLIRNGKVKLTGQAYQNWVNIKRRMRDKNAQKNEDELQNAQSQSTTVEEDSGLVLTAAKGAVLDMNGNLVSQEENKRDEGSDKKEKAKQAGYNSVLEYNANMRKPGQTGFTTSDYIRLGAIAADIASIPAAYVAGYGTAVSAGLGVGSSIATLVTDITDDGFQLKDLAGFGANLAMDAAGLFGGAGKVGKIVKNLLNFGPMLLGAWSVMQNGDKYAELFDKLQKGKSLTVEDWKTLALGISIVAGLNRAGASSYKNRKMANNARLAQTEPSFKLKVKKNGQKTEIDLTKSDVEKLTGDYDQANNALKQMKGDQYSLIPVKESRFGNGIKGFFRPKISKENPIDMDALRGSEISIKDVIKGNYNTGYAGDVNGVALNNGSLATPLKGAFLDSWFANTVNRYGRWRGFADDLSLAVGNRNPWYWRPRFKSKNPTVTYRENIPISNNVLTLVTPVLQSTVLQIAPVTIVPQGNTGNVAPPEIWYKSGGKLSRFDEYVQSHKSGGRARLIDYEKLIQKERHHSLKQQLRATESATKKLNADLDRLSRELIALLRAVFK